MNELSSAFSVSQRVGRRNIRDKNMKKNPKGIALGQEKNPEVTTITASSLLTTNHKPSFILLLSSGQYGQSLSVMCRPMNLVPLWRAKHNQSKPSNQQSAWDPSARALHAPLQPGKKPHAWLNQDPEDTQ